jgi:hypothetical protein
MERSPKVERNLVASVWNASSWLIPFVVLSTSPVISLRLAVGKFLPSWQFQTSMSRVSLAISAIVHHVRDGPGVARAPSDAMYSLLESSVMFPQLVVKDKTIY